MKKTVIILFCFLMHHGMAEDFVITKPKISTASISALRESCFVESVYAEKNINTLNTQITNTKLAIIEGEKKMSRTDYEAALDDLTFITKQLDYTLQYMPSKLKEKKKK